MAVAGMRLLSHLQHLVPGFQEQSSPDLDLVICLASFTDDRDTWTRPEALEAATTLLDDYLVRFTTDDPNALTKLLTNLLQTRLRPRFAKSKTNAITEQGRKAAFPLPNAAETSGGETEVKPWKYTEVYIVTVFRWILRHLTVWVPSQWLTPLVLLLTGLTKPAVHHRGPVASSDPPTPDYIG